MASDPGLTTSAGRSRAGQNSSSGADGGLARTVPLGPDVGRDILLMLKQDPWKPHPLSPEEIQTIRQQSRKLHMDYLRQHAYVRMLKDRPLDTAEERQRLALVVYKYEAEMMKTYISYQLVFWRTFPIHDLPVEILSNIIRYVVWSATSSPVGIRWRLQLTWVSRYLRHIAISDSTLWNAIWFRAKPPFERPLAFIERSRTSPLDLRIDDTPTYRFTDQGICSLLETLTPHLHHIRILIILLENWEPILSVLKWLSDYGKEKHRPLTMERFEIHRTGNPYLWPGLVWRGTKFNPVNHAISLYSLFGGRHVPELKSFTMNGIHIDWANTHSLNNLTALDLRRIPLELCPPLPCFLQILASSPMLNRLSLDGAGPAGNPPTISNYPTVNLPHLHTLILANFAFPFPKSIVSHFTAPNVKDLTLMNFKMPNYGPFYEFMTDRFQKIKLLTLASVSCPIDTVLPVMIKWLDSMPLLAYARLNDLEPDILQAFLFDPDTMKIHPDLPPPLRTAFGMVEDTSYTGLIAQSKEVLEDVEKKPRLVSPRLNVLEVETIRPNTFTKFVLARKLCGVPVKKTYMARSMAKDFSDAALTDINRHFTSLTLVDIGAKTREEKDLLNEP